MDEEGLVKIRIDLPNHWAVGGESLWAEPLGNDLYRIENVPFYAYGLNFQDIVFATPESENYKPEIRELRTASGHSTFRIFFQNHIDKAQQETILDSMKELGITYERANEIYIALDLEPDRDYQAVFDRLDTYSEQGVLGFETCEARIEGSFDDLPEEEEEDEAFS